MTRNYAAAMILGAAVVLGLATQPTDAQGAGGAQSSVTAIDIALEPDATMLQHAEAVNARLRGSYPKGYSLDATHRPHVTMLQRYVRTADLPKIYAAVSKIMTANNPPTWKLQAFKIDHAVWSGWPSRSSSPNHPSAY